MALGRRGKMKFAATFYTSLLITGLAFGQSVTSIDGIKLTLDHPGTSNDLDIQIDDYWSANHGLGQVTCELWHVERNGIEHKVQDIALTLNGTNYAKRFHFMEFTHGTMAKIVYKPEWLPYPMVAWIRLNFH